MTDDRVNNGGHTGLTTSLGLLERARANDRAAWDRLESLYRPLVCHWCRVCRIPEQDWPDVCQEVFLAVSRNLGTFRKESGRGSFRGWLRTVTRSKVTDLHRRRADGATVVGAAALDLIADPTAGDSADAPAEQGVVYRQALELIERDFEPKTWRAFWLVVVEDRSPADAAAELGLSANAVYLAKGRVLRRLREEFADLLDPPTGAD